MKVIPLAQLTSGMVVAKDVVDMSGRMLLGRSAIITDKHLKILKTWGVAEVHVLASPGGEDQQGSLAPCHIGGNAILSRQAKEIALQMFCNKTHPLNQLIITYATRAIYRRLERGESVHAC